PRDAPVSERRADVGLQIFDALRPEPASPLDVAAARGRARAQDGARARTERGRVPLRVARSAARALARSTAARAAPVPLARARARFDAAERRVEAGRGARPACAGAAARHAFIVDKAKEPAVIAGYPWFEVWGRDTLIALPGLFLVHRDVDAAREVLRTMVRHMQDGLVPNRLPDEGKATEFHAADATL